MSARVFSTTALTTGLLPLSLNMAKNVNDNFYCKFEIHSSSQLQANTQADKPFVRLSPDKPSTHFSSQYGSIDECLAYGFTLHLSHIGSHRHLSKSHHRGKSHDSRRPLNSPDPLPDYQVQQDETRDQRFLLH